MKLTSLISFFALTTGLAYAQQETPVVATLQPPTVPLKGRPSKFRLLITYSFFGFFLSLVWVLWLKDALSDFKKKA